MGNERYYSRRTVLVYGMPMMMLLLCLCQVLVLVASDTTNDATCDATGLPKLKNSAFVFVKPHANTPATRDLVANKLKEAGIDILKEIDIDGETIDKKGLIDQHYYSIASKATILPVSKIPVPEDKFEETFGESWKTVLKENRACNAMEACKRFDCTPAELNEEWQKADPVVKFGGGFYCAKVSVNDQPPLYTFNAFFMNMRSKFVGPTNSIHCYEVEWDSNTLSWSSFRNNILGPTDPNEAPKGSIRRTILDKYKKLGLTAKPNKGDNGVHASASPFEGLAEKLNWLNRQIKQEPFGNALLQSGISNKQIKRWCLDPQIKISTDGGVSGSIFDELEELDADECLAKMIELNGLN